MNVFAVLVSRHVYFKNGEMFKDIASILVDFHKMILECDPVVELPYEKLLECLKCLYSPKSLLEPYDWEDGYKTTLNI